jgi:hypothetical protein
MCGVEWGSDDLVSSGPSPTPPEPTPTADHKRKETER